MNKACEATLRHGAYYVLSNFGRLAELAELTQALLLEAVESISGSEARESLRRAGLEKLHEHLPAEQIGALRDHVMPAVRPVLFQLTLEIGRDFFGLDQEFFIDDYTILRINYPYAVALKADLNTENPGIGRVHPSVRHMKSSIQKRDPLFDPRGANKNTPPASWAHAPHKDTWCGHSLDGINLWCAITEVNKENCVLFFPGTFDKAYQVDPRTLCIEEGYELPPPIEMALHAGQAMVFNPELLHATHLNTSDDTRIALAARMNPGRPRFNPRCFYAREFWHSSRDIEMGQLDAIHQFSRDSNLGPAGSGSQVARTSAQKKVREPIRAVRGGDGKDRVRLDAFNPKAEELYVEAPDGLRILLFRQPDGWCAVQAACPHLGVDLAAGHHDADRLYCPNHGVTYNTATGRSSSPLLTLRTFPVVVQGDWLVITREEA
jgi:nitrite reductase/ring-hydroxylating ferredoxin subunit